MITLNGNQVIKAPQQTVFNALLNPEILKNSLPGCEAAEVVETASGKEIKLTVSPNFPGLKGPYTLFVRPEEVVEPNHLVLITEPSSGIGTIKARCTIDLSGQGGQTTLSYATQATLEGKIAATPEMLIKPAVKGAMDHFFKNLEKQLA